MRESDRQETNGPRSADERPEPSPDETPRVTNRAGSVSSEPAEEDAASWSPSADELAAMLERHRRWVESNGASGACAVLGGADLREADLVGTHLERAILADADLRGALQFVRAGVCLTAGS